MQLRRQWFINCRCLRHQKQNTGFGRLRNLWGHTLNAFLNWGTATSEIFLCHFFLDQNSAFFVLFLLPRLSASSHRLARVSPYYITTRTFHSEIWVRIGITKQVLIDHDWYAYILVRCRSPLASAMASEPRFVLLFKFLNWSSFSNLSARVRLTQVVFLGGTQFYAERG